MIKVLIIDDEFYSREGMKKTIPWDLLGCTICGEAENGFQGIDLCKQLKPEIIITDIRMPGLDGISMCKEIKEFLPKSKFIIITGYDDFQYARGAVKINALDFILKPVEDSELIGAIEKAAQCILEEKNISSLSSEKILLNIMRGKRDLADIYNYFPKESNIKILLIENQSYDMIIDLGKDFINYEITTFIDDYFRDNCSQHTFYIVAPHVNRQAIIIESCYPDLHNHLENIKSMVSEKFNGMLTIGVSKDSAVENIMDLYKDAKGLLEESFYQGKNSIITKKSIESEELNLEWINDCVKNIILSLMARDKESIKNKILILYHNMKKHKVPKAMVINFSMELILEAKNSIIDHNIPFNYLEDINLEKNNPSLDDIRDMVLSYIFTSIDLLRDLSGRLEDNSIEKAIAFIDENFHKNISLSTVAKEVYLNESYFSRTLKKILGMGFSEYIRKLRIEEAITLLSKGCTVNETALKVGYSDYRSFSSNFKKYTGYSPKEYMIK